MAHFPQTPDTRLDFNNDNSASDSVGRGLANRPDAFKAFVFGGRFRMGGGLLRL